MMWFDPKFAKNKHMYVAQTLLASLVMFFVLTVLDAKTHAALVASLGASSFIAFTMPHAQVARPRYILGGYAVGICVGVLCFLVSLALAKAEPPISPKTIEIGLASLAMGMAIFLMVVLNLEHPPAAGVALGLVLNECDPVAIGVIIVGILILTGVKTMLKPSLINLL
jgi:CBS-domain-containing membrane protein